LHELIPMCEGALRLTFDAGAIQSARPERARAAVELQSRTKTRPTGDRRRGPAKPLLLRVGPKAMTQILDWPPNALLKKHCLADLAGALDHPLSLASLPSAAASHLPTTRRRLAGAIPLGAGKSHSLAAEWTLARMLSAGRHLEKRTCGLLRSG
jgi:hypothetical protein